MTDQRTSTANAELREIVARILVPYWYGRFENQERAEGEENFRPWKNPPGTPNERAYELADKILAAVGTFNPAQPSAGAPKLWQERAPNGSWFVQTEHDGHIFFGADKDSAEQCLRALSRVSAQQQPDSAAWPNSEWNYDLSDMPMNSRFMALKFEPEVFRHLHNDDWVVVPSNGRMFKAIAWKALPEPVAPPQNVPESPALPSTPSGTEPSAPAPESSR